MYFGKTILQNGTKKTIKYKFVVCVSMYVLANMSITQSSLS